MCTILNILQSVSLPCSSLFILTFTVLVLAVLALLLLLLLLVFFFPSCCFSFILILVIIIIIFFLVVLLVVVVVAVVVLLLLLLFPSSVQHPAIPPCFSPSGTWASGSRTKGLEVGTLGRNFPAVGVSSLKFTAKAPENWPKIVPNGNEASSNDGFSVFFLLLVLRRVKMMVGFLSAEFLFVNGDAPYDKNSNTNNFARNF